MKNKALLVAIVFVVVIAAGRVMTAPRQQAEESSAEIGADDYEEINAEIMELIAELEQGSFNATQPGDELSIELFELDPENEELGDIY
jgi:hypothetical protein